MEKKLAVIESARMDYFDRGIMMVYAPAQYEDGWHQDVLGICLDEYDKEKEQRVGTAEGMNFLIKLLQFFGVNNLTEVKNHYCYVLTEGEGLACKPIGLEQLEINRNGRCKLKKLIYADCFKRE